MFSFFAIRRSLLLILTFAGAVVFAQKADEDLPQYSVDWFEDASLADLLGMKIGVASSGRQVSQREAPGITTLISADEIQNSGARDLEEVLRLLVPGIDFGQDVQGMSGIIMRGSWSHESKILVMLDGVEMNEFTYNNLVVANRFDLSMIDRIEVIRGPGSARYGGTAELGVINIISRTGGQIKGVEVAGQGAASANALTRAHVSLHAGAARNGWEYAVHGMYGTGRRSDQQYTSTSGQTYDLTTDAFDMRPASAYFRLAGKGLSVSLMGDVFATSFRHFGGLITAQTYPSVFRNGRADIRYEIAAGKPLKFTLGYTGGYNESYRLRGTIAPADTDIVFNLLGSQINRRNHVFVYTDYTPTAAFSLNGGLEYRHDRLSSTNGGVPLMFWNGQERVTLNLASAFAQAIWKTKIATFTAGVRLDQHNIYHLAAAPRLALTRVWDRFHVKLLAAGAYRAPAAMQLTYSSYDPATGLPLLVPERAWVGEVEAGYQFNTQWYVQTNVFSCITHNTIIFSLTDLEEVYQNQGRCGSSGLEAEVRYKSQRGYATLNYSYYSALGLSQIPNYSVDSSDNALMGAAQHKLALNAGLKVSNIFSINPSAVFLNGKYVVTGVTADGEDIETQLAPTFLLNLALQCDGLLHNRLDLSLTGTNLLGSTYALAQPYHTDDYGNDAPVFYPRQEVALRATLRLFSRQGA